MASYLDLHPLYLSVKIASVSTIVVFFTGVFLARLLSRKEFFGKSIIEAIFLLPMVLPPTVVGFGLLLLFGKNGFLGKWLFEWFGIQVVFSWVGAVIASIVVSFPLMYQNALGSFRRYDVRLENAARTMGASEWRVFWTISFPLAWPSLLSGCVLSFARALGEFGATLMLAGYLPGKTDTIPLAIYFAVQSGHSEQVAFWVLVVTGLGFSGILWLNLWNKKINQRNGVDMEKGA